MNNSMCILVIVYGLLTYIYDISCHKILVMSPVGCPSHRIAIDPVILELAERGHEITYVSGYEQVQDTPKVQNIVVPEFLSLLESSGLHYFRGKLTSPTVLFNIYKTMLKMTHATYKLPLVIDILNNPMDSKNRPKFDLLMVDASTNEFTLPLAQRMGIPAVYINPSGLLTYHAWSFNIPHPYATVPSLLAGFPVKMDFVDRFLNTACNMVFMWLRDYNALPSLDDVIRLSYPEARPIRELEREVSLLIANSHFSFQMPVPTMPNFIDAGGMHLRPAKPLPKDLEEFMNESEHGVIYFSLGSSTDESIIPSEMKDKLLAAFARLKENVLFKSNSPLEGPPPNMKFIKWAPQNDLLAHPKMKLFVTHGGGLSMMESAYHGVPQLAFPLSVDHFGHMAYAKEKGFAEVMDWQTFTLEELNSILYLMLNNRSYAKNAEKVSRIMKDNPQHPKDRAVFWIEYVIRHKGAPHLRSGADSLNFYQYFLFDVIGVALLLASILLVLVFLLLRAVHRLVANQSKTSFIYKFKIS